MLMAATPGAALSLVLLLRAVSGNIEIKILGFEFKGAAAPIIMWILCFLALPWRSRKFGILSISRAYDP
jgi:hypothetical protein